MLQINQSNEGTIKQFRVYTKGIVVYFDKEDLTDLNKFLTLFCEGRVKQVAVVGRDGMCFSDTMPVLSEKYSVCAIGYNFKQIKEFLNSPSVINYNSNS